MRTQVGILGFSDDGRGKTWESLALSAIQHPTSSIAWKNSRAMADSPDNNDYGGCAHDMDILDFIVSLDNLETCGRGGKKGSNTVGICTKNSTSM